MNKNAFHSLGNNLLFGITQALYIDYCLTHIYNQIHSWIYKDNNHGGELRDFRNKNGDTCQKTLSLIFRLLLVRFAWDLKQMPLISYKNMTISYDFQTKIWYKSY